MRLNPAFYAFLSDLHAKLDPAERHIADYTWQNRERLIRWPKRALLFSPGAIRESSRGYHSYSDEQKAQAREAKIAADSRSNGPAILAFRVAGGERPIRSDGRKGWPVHHIYDGQFPGPGKTSSVRAVKDGQLFSQAAGLVSIHPIADAIAGECAFFAWLLRKESFVRFAFDPDGVFSIPKQSARAL